MTGSWRSLLTCIPPFPGTTDLEQAIDAQGLKTVQRYDLKFAVVALMLTWASVTQAAAPGAIVSGIVRDSQGVAQMGALIQVMAGDSVTAGTAFTDMHGRYLVANLLPGKYQVRASAALLAPAVRANLQLRSGGRAIVNLTLSTLFDTAAWLPAERRKSDEPRDDWKWTLRSSANRPILRIVEDGEIVLISSSASETSSASDSAKASVMTGDNTFGQGGVHNTLSVDRVFVDGADVVFRVDMGVPRSPVMNRPSTEIQTGYQRRLGFAGASRTIVSYQSHPEMLGTGHSSGLDAMQVASAQKMKFGDMAEIEAGSALDVIHTSGYAVASHPFLRVTAHPTSDWMVKYRMATSRDLQAFDGLDVVQPELPVAVMYHGRLRTAHGLHQEVSVGRKVGKGVLQVGLYHDNLDQVLVSGGGVLNADDINGGASAGANLNGVLADSMTGGFRLLTSGYKTQGINITLTEPLTPTIWAALEYSNGAALASDGEAQMTLPMVGSELKTVSAESVTLALRGRVLHSGTNVRAAYRWQPENLVTAVDPYAAFSDQAYFSFYLRQPVNCGRWLPPGLEATIDVTNLLEQGYRPFLSADGRTLYLAQSPRTIQAGLAFNF